MKLRNILVKPFGLKNDGFEALLSNIVRRQNDREIIFGVDDKHLHFEAAL